MTIETKDVFDIIDEYATYLSVIHEKSKGTVKMYTVNLKLFFEFIKKQDKFKSIQSGEEIIKAIELDDLYEFINYSKNKRKNSASTRANKIAAIKSFFKYCKEKLKIISYNPCSELEAPKIAKRQINYLTLEESQKLLESVDSRNYERDFCIVTFFLNCGLRLNELCNIRVKDIRKDILVVRGKGDKDRSVYLNESCLKALNKYMEVRKELKNEFLFLSERGNLISNRQVQNIIHNSIINAGLDPNKYTVHKLRHTAATLLFKYGNVDIRTLQKILGHKNIATTTIYTHVDDESVRRAVKANPLNRKNR